MITVGAPTLKDKIVEASRGTDGPEPGMGCHRRRQSRQSLRHGVEHHPVAALPHNLEEEEGGGVAERPGGERDRCHHGVKRVGGVAAGQMRA
jgi:hypothetical protein